MRTHYVAFAAALLVTAATPTFASEHTSDLLKPRQVQELEARAVSAADHDKLSRHYAAAASKYDADATRHEAMAAKYRKYPTASETKRPGAPDTAAHCERLAKRAADAAKEARALASAHERMAAEH